MNQHIVQFNNQRRVGRRNSRLLQARAWALLSVMCLFVIVQPLGLAQDRPRTDVHANTTLYLPLASNMPFRRLPFGVQVDGANPTNALFDSAQTLHAGWLRNAIRWREVQPDEGQPIHWDQLAAFEQTTLKAQLAGMSTEVVIYDSPRWATINQPAPTSCGAIRTDKFKAFADFMRQIIAHYQAAPFNVHDWELGNEMDIDPRLVGVDNWFGCWGNINDPYYGGQQYGEMLKAVVPTLRAEDSVLRIWHGGLLLDKPDTTDSSKGKPERFLNGVLAAGGGPYFDVLPFHAYPVYVNQKIDHENELNSPWTPLGGFVVGKARYLRKIMSAYKVSKPLFLNETSLMCPDVGVYRAWCLPPIPAFYQMQSIYMVRTFTRALAEDIIGTTWFALNGPGWMYTGLLQGDTPTMAFTAYQQFTTQIRWTDLKPRRLAYDPAVEAYAFSGHGSEVQIVWAHKDVLVPLKIPRSTFINAVDMQGNPLAFAVSGDDVIINVPFEPVYITVQTS